GSPVPVNWLPAGADPGTIRAPAPLVIGDEGGARGWSGSAAKGLPAKSKEPSVFGESSVFRDFSAFRFEPVRIVPFAAFLMALVFGAAPIAQAADSRGKATMTHRTQTPPVAT